MPISPPKPIEFVVRLLPAYGQENSTSSFEVGRFTCLDHPELIAQNARKALLAFPKKDQIDLNGRITITRPDGSLFTEVFYTADCFIPADKQSAYPRSGI